MEISSCPTWNLLHPQCPTLNFLSSVGQPILICVFKFVVHLISLAIFGHIRTLNFSWALAAMIIWYVLTGSNNSRGLPVIIACDNNKLPPGNAILNIFSHRLNIIQAIQSFNEIFRKYVTGATWFKRGNINSVVLLPNGQQYYQVVKPWFCCNAVLAMINILNSTCTCPSSVWNMPDCLTFETYFAKCQTGRIKFSTKMHRISDICQTRAKQFHLHCQSCH